MGRCRARTGVQLTFDDPMGSGFVFGLPELRAVLLATAIIGAIAALRYRSVPPDGRRGR